MPILFGVKKQQPPLDVYTKLLLHFDGDIGDRLDYDESFDHKSVASYVESKTVQFNYDDNTQLPIEGFYNAGTDDIRILSNKLRLTATTQNGYAAMRSTFRLRGDFTSSVEWVSVNLPYEASSSNRFQFGIVSTTDSQRYIIMTRDYGQWGNRIYSSLNSGSGTTFKQYTPGVANGKFRMLRSGSTATLQYDIGGGWISLENDSWVTDDCYVFWQTYKAPTETENVIFDIDNIYHGQSNLLIYPVNYEDTVQSKFGGASSYISGGKKYMWLNNSTDWAFGTEDFTIDLWAKIDGITGKQRFLTHWNSSGSDGNRGFIFDVDADANLLRFIYSADGVSNTGIFTSNWTLDNGWHHFAAVRNSADLKLYVDGTQRGITHDISTNSIYGGNSYLQIGGEANGLANSFQGYIDELRVSKGIARWTSNFTAPTKPYRGAE